MSASFSYEITGVPDYDQRWDWLPNDGKNYCVPTAATNWIHYLAKHGWPMAEAFPVANDKDFHAIHLNIVTMASYMDTDKDDGTGGADGFYGLIDFLDDRYVPAVVTTDSVPECGHITLSDLEACILVNGLVILSVGFYKKDGDCFERDGGHATSLIGLKRKSNLEADIEVRDPNDEIVRLQSQSPRVRTKATLRSEVRNIEGDSVNVLRWDKGTDPYRFSDRWRAILPAFALTNPTAKVIVAHSASFENQSINTRKFTLPFNAELADLAIHPSVPLASMISRGSGDIWTLDLARESWSKTTTVASARLLTYGGRDRRLFVTRGSEILSFDSQGKELGKLDTGVAIEAISYDQKNNRMIVAAPSVKRLLAATPTLQILEDVDAPEVPGAGRLAMSVNSRDATIVLSREGSAEAATLRWHSTGARAWGRFTLMTKARTAALHVDGKARMFAVENDKIATFDTDGNRLTGHIFEGLPAGRLLKVARSSHNFDPVRAHRKEWKD